MQNLVVLMEPSDDAYRISEKGGNMCLNQFSIDEDAAFELSGIHYLKKSSFDIRDNSDMKYFLIRKSKGKRYLSQLQ